MRKETIALAVAALAWTRDARAVEPVAEDEIVDEELLGPRGALRTRADEVSFDARARSLELAGDVRVDAAPFHLRADRIRLARTRYGIEVEGKGKLKFCPCLGTPLTVGFEKAIVAPPGDLVLVDPVLRVYSVPVFALPYFWLRSADRIGLLPPDLAYRGQDGFYAGGGVHVPFTRGDRARSIDLRGGGYLKGGFAVDARLRTPSSTTRVTFDRLPGARAPLLPGGGGEDPDQGLRVDARGATRHDAASVAWDADVLRGRRGVVATSDLDAAARPWDRASAEATIRSDRVAASMGARATNRRGGALTGLEVGGPVSRLRASGALLGRITWDGTVDGGALRAAERTQVTPGLDGVGTTAYARGDVGFRGAANVGPVAALAEARSAGGFAQDAERGARELASSGRVRASLPLAKDVGTSLTHVLEPYLEGALFHADRLGSLSALPTRGAIVASGAVPVADLGLATRLGHWSTRDGLVARIGAGAAREPDRGEEVHVARARIAASSTWAAATVDGGAVFGSRDARGGAGTARVRVGQEAGLRLTGHVALRKGVDPLLARALDDASTVAPAGFLLREGTTTGGGLVVPWSRFLTTSAFTDVDATSGELLSARGAVELRDRCGCVTVRAFGSHRLGREGVDVWLTVDLAPDGLAMR